MFDSNLNVFKYSTLHIECNVHFKLNTEATSEGELFRITAVFRVIVCFPEALNGIPLMFLKVGFGVTYLVFFKANEMRSFLEFLETSKLGVVCYTLGSHQSCYTCDVPQVRYAFNLLCVLRWSLRYSMPLWPQYVHRVHAKYVLASYGSCYVIHVKSRLKIVPRPMHLDFGLL